jgi:hypothetical protein
MAAKARVAPSNHFFASRGRAPYFLQLYQLFPASLIAAGYSHLKYETF